MNRYDESQQRKQTGSSGTGTRAYSGSGSSSGSSSRVPLERVAGSLSRTLAQMAWSSSSSQQQYIPVDEPGGIDWSSTHFDTELQQPLDVQTTVQLGKNLEAYLREEGALNHDSDDDPEERSEASDSDSESDAGENSSNDEYSPTHCCRFPARIH